MRFDVVNHRHNLFEDFGLAFLNLFPCQTGLQTRKNLMALLNLKSNLITFMTLNKTVQDHSKEVEKMLGWFLKLRLLFICLEYHMLWQLR